MKAILALKAIEKRFESAGRSLQVLNDISFEIDPKTSCAIVGPSGSGKTTLLGICAGLERPSSGKISLAGMEINNKSEDELAALRNQKVGFVFQNFQLMPTLTALENVMVPAELLQRDNPRERAVELLGRVGLEDRLDHYPVQLSGGEQQRVALARAFINQPEILFADEPTGNLDDETSHTVEELLFDLNSTQGTTLILVTHDLELARRCDRVIRLKGGHIEEDTRSVEQENYV